MHDPEDDLCVLTYGQFHKSHILDVGIGCKHLLKMEA